MAIQKIKGIVLQSRDLTETSKLVSILTPEGMVRAVARGARRPQSALRGKLELFTYGLAIYYPSRTSDLHTLSRFEVLNSFPGTKSTLEKAALFYYLAELVTGASFGAEQCRGLFDLLLEILERGEQLASLAYARLWFELEFLKSLGVLPPLGQCSRCGKRAVGTMYFSRTEGNWICAGCGGRERGAVPLEPGLLSIVRFILRGGLKNSGTLKLSPGQESALLRLNRYLIDFQLDKKLKSLPFLSHIYFSLREK